MPTYEYKREDGTVFEIMQGMNDEPLTECPTTGLPVKRVISGGGGVVYKGSGFYITDYKNGNGNGTGSEKGSSKTESGETKKSASDSSE